MKRRIVMIILIFLLIPGFGLIWLPQVAEANTPTFVPSSFYDVLRSAINRYHNALKNLGIYRSNMRGWQYPDFIEPISWTDYRYNMIYNPRQNPWSVTSVLARLQQAYLVQAAGQKCRDSSTGLMVLLQRRIAYDRHQ